MVYTTLANPAADGREPRSAVGVELLDVRAVAALLACSVRHIYRLADVGKMPPPLKLGTLIRWRRASLLGWIDDGCPPVTTPGRRGGSRNV